MARKRTSTFEDLVTLLSRLPWWASLLIGVVSWLILRPVATSPMAAPAGATLDDLSGIMLSQAWRVFAMFGQYLIPIICLFGAIGSIVGRQSRKKLLNNVKSATQPGKAIDGLGWREFEHLIGEAFRRKGYSITETGGNGADGGIDLILRKSGEKYLVQCKHWRSMKVGVPVVREFFGAMAVEGAAGGFVVTSGQFTAEAKSFAEGRNIQLVDGGNLKRLLANRNPTSSVTELDRTSKPAPQPVEAEPACPLCKSAMIKRTARKGANAGNVFWGCGTYPKCRGVVNV
ncbi:restriction endonuclease [Halopseudomonas laoshanensis]|uniref:Restriction endonuclease n=1 Tax=Halopseudomonas laoshanensis TaxID=2268758 RepID=A0A7V7GW67_9GAMM|nr:restriction endonuclease [Halopseudomonas laoshanensis]KAA0696323.1 restriction endonuclease [Halopseudomonas laoshanensis]